MFEGKGFSWLTAAFFVVISVDTWHWIKHPAPAYSGQPAILPPPYIYVGTGVVFGLLSILADVFSPELAGALALGLTIGVVIAETQGTLQLAGGAGQKANQNVQVTASEVVLSGPNSNTPA